MEKKEYVGVVVDKEKWLNDDFHSFNIGELLLTRFNKSSSGRIMCIRQDIEGHVYETEQWIRREDIEILGVL